MNLYVAKHFFMLQYCQHYPVCIHCKLYVPWTDISQVDSCGFKYLLLQIVLLGQLGQPNYYTSSLAITTTIINIKNPEPSR